MYKALLLSLLLFSGVCSAYEFHAADRSLILVEAKWWNAGFTEWRKITWGYTNGVPVDGWWSHESTSPTVFTALTNSNDLVFDLGSWTELDYLSYFDPDSIEYEEVYTFGGVAWFDFDSAGVLRNSATMPSDFGQWDLNGDPSGWEYPGSGSELSALEYFWWGFVFVFGAGLMGLGARWVRIILGGGTPE